MPSRSPDSASSMVGLVLALLAGTAFAQKAELPAVLRH